MATANLVLLIVLVAGMSLMSCAEAAVDRLKEDVSPLVPLGSAGDLRNTVPCDSWRLAVEAYNKRDWATVPTSCEGYVRQYMLGGQYRRDSSVVVDEAIAYAEGLRLGGGNGKKVWVFDMDETALSTLPYYATEGFGTKPYNATSFNEYIEEGNAPVLPETLRLFNKLMSLGIKPVFLTGRSEDQRAITVTNLHRQGYSGWMQLLLKPARLKATAIAFKSRERQKLYDAGYVIVGNIGDQWSDILGAPEGMRTFKLPDPLYLRVVMDHGPHSPSQSN